MFKPVTVALRTALRSSGFALALIAATAGVAHAQTQLAYWNFDTQASAPATSAPWSPAPSLAVAGGIDSATATMSLGGGSFAGVNGNTEPGFYYKSGGANTPGTSTASAYALQLSIGTATTGMNNGSSLIWTASTVGYNGIQISYDTAKSSSVAFNTQSLYYSTDGTSFTLFQNFTNIVSSTSTYGTATFDLSGIPTLNNNPNAAFEIVFSGAPSYTSTGHPYNNIDNVTVSGIASAAAAPEPGALVSTLFGAMALIGAGRFRRGRR